MQHLRERLAAPPFPMSSSALETWASDDVILVRIRKDRVGYVPFSAYEVRSELKCKHPVKSGSYASSLSLVLSPTCVFSRVFSEIDLMSAAVSSLSLEREVLKHGPS